MHKNITPPLDSMDLIKLYRDHKNNIGKDKATYSEGVLFGYGIRVQVPCLWKNHCSQPNGYLYTVGCNGKPQASMIDIDGSS